MFEVPDDNTPDRFGAEKVIGRWNGIEEQGHPLGSERYGGNDKSGAGGGRDAE